MSQLTEHEVNIIMQYDRTYRCIHRVYISESYEELKEGTLIIDITDKSNFFRRLFARIMGYVIWNYHPYCNHIYLHNSKPVFYMKRAIFNRYFTPIIRQDGQNEDFSHN